MFIKQILSRANLKIVRRYFLIFISGRDDIPKKQKLSQNSIENYFKPTLKKICFIVNDFN